MDIKIVSGGQTGVDRAALDAALELGLPAGGWCPEGRLAEDGPIPIHYPVQELPGAGYRQRTEQNVIDSDGTVIVYFGELSGGTKLTMEYCRKWGKPHLVIDAEQHSVDKAVNLLEEFVDRHGIQVLNIAGPRASGEPRGYPFTKALVSGLIDRAQ